MMSFTTWCFCQIIHLSIGKTGMCTQTCRHASEQLLLFVVEFCVLIVEKENLFVTLKTFCSFIISKLKRQKLCVNKSNLQRHRYWELDTGAPNKGNVHSKLRTRLHKGSYVIKPTWQLVRKLRHFIKGLSYYSIPFIHLFAWGSKLIPTFYYEHVGASKTKRVVVLAELWWHSKNSFHLNYYSRTITPDPLLYWTIPWPWNLTNE